MAENHPNIPVVPIEVEPRTTIELGCPGCPRASGVWIDHLAGATALQAAAGAAVRGIPFSIHEELRLSVSGQPLTPNPAVQSKFSVTGGRAYPHCDMKCLRNSQGMAAAGQELISSLWNAGYTSCHALEPSNNKG